MKNFEISFSNLKNLPEDLPRTIESCCYFHANKLTSLMGSPRIVGQIFSCDNNQLTSLKDSPRIVEDWFCCWTNRLISLDFLPVKFGSISPISPSSLFKNIKYEPFR